MPTTPVRKRKKPAPEVTPSILNELPIGSRFAVVESPARMGARKEHGPFILTSLQGDYAYVTSEKSGSMLMYSVAQTKVVPAKFQLDLSKVDSRHSVNSSGTDPEIFVGDSEGKLIPAFSFLEPQPKIFAAQKPYWDGFQAEFGISPGHCHGYAADRVRSGLKAVLAAARKLDPGAKLLPKTVVEIDPDLLKVIPPEHSALGCNPSENAYGDAGEVVPDPTELKWRFAGGHIHFQFGNATLESRKAFAKWMDFFAAVPAVAVFEGIDDPVRRRFYGRAGEYRPKSYGIEYRTLSNAWLFAPELLHMTWNLARHAHGLSLILPNYTDYASEEEVRNIINNCDADGARKLVKTYSSIFNRAARIYWGEAGMKLFNHIVDHGVESAFPNFKDLEKNWKLKSRAGWDVHSNGSWQTFYQAGSRFAGPTHNAEY